MVYGGTVVWVFGLGLASSVRVCALQLSCETAGMPKAIRTDSLSQCQVSLRRASDRSAGSL
ncbi:hypothetical protein T484DRAFT_1963440 [Baffinella frigidus]|nr:hypothetical protein T484DRAFT_1963440 [Cryptophyta sp. CCMP2293]